MRSAVIRHSDLQRVRVQLFLLALAHATPGPWDALDGWVISTSIAEDDERSNDFYGGKLIGESMCRADAVVLAACRSLLPAICQAWLNLEPELRETRRWSEFYKREAYRLEAENHEIKRRAADRADQAQALLSFKDAEIIRLRDRIDSLREMSVR